MSDEESLLLNKFLSNMYLKDFRFFSEYFKGLQVFICNKRHEEFIIGKMRCDNILSKSSIMKCTDEFLMTSDLFNVKLTIYRWCTLHVGGVVREKMSSKKERSLRNILSK